MNGAMDGVGPHQELHARNIRDPSKMLEQGPDRQRAPCRCSGGLSSIRGASESDAHTIGWRSVGGNLRGAIGQVSSSAATRLHEGGFTARSFSASALGASEPKSASTPVIARRVSGSTGT